MTSLVGEGPATAAGLFFGAPRRLHASDGVINNCV
jgi:hypothetical protein